MSFRLFSRLVVVRLAQFCFIPYIFSHLMCLIWPGLEYLSCLCYLSYWCACVLSYMCLFWSIFVLSVSESYCDL